MGEEEPSYETRLARKIAAQIRPQGKFTLGQLALDWLKRVDRVTVDNERRHIQHLGPLLAMREGELKKRDVEHVFAELRQKYGPAYLNAIRSTASLIIRDAQGNEQWQGLDPFGLMKRSKVIRKDYAPKLTPLEVAKTLVQLSPELHAIAITMIYLAARPGEVLGARKDDVDMIAGTWNICRSHGRNTTKTKSERRVPIVEGVWKVFCRQVQRAPGPLLFPDCDGKMFGRHQLSDRWRTAMKRAGVIDEFNVTCRRQGCGYTAASKTKIVDRCPKCLFKLWSEPVPKKVTFYDLRHLSASFHKGAGCDPLVVKLLMGHARNVHEGYVHLTPEFIRAELHKFRLPEITD